MDIPKEWRLYSDTLRALGEYVESRLVPRLGKLGELSARQDALRLIFLCARSVLEPMIASTRTSGFRGHAALCRSLWEHWIDFETVRRGTDTTGGQYLAFCDVQAWNHFVRVRQTRHRLGIEDIPLPIDRPGVAERIDATLQAHYGVGIDAVRKVGHWNRRDLFARASALGKDEELYYREFYSFLSWAAHGTGTGVVGMDARFLDRCALQWRIEAFTTFRKMATELVQDLGWLDEVPVIDRIAEMSVGDFDPNEERP